MCIWRVEYFPQSGGRHSPYDYIANLPNKSEQAQIIHRLDVIRKIERVDWPSEWVHPITKNISQLTAGNNRLMYFLDNRTIVIVHAFRKISQKTREKDINRAEIHRDRYLLQKYGAKK